MRVCYKDYNDVGNDNQNANDIQKPAFHAYNCTCLHLVKGEFKRVREASRTIVFTHLCVRASHYCHILRAQ